MNDDKSGGAPDNMMALTTEEHARKHELVPEQETRQHQDNEWMPSILRGMADMVRAMNERMEQLARDVRLLQPVTPAQTEEIHAAIRARAAALCVEYRADERNKAVANAIRREIRRTHGVQSMRELPRVEFPVVVKQIELWDDYKAMKAIKAKEESK